MKKRITLPLEVEEKILQYVLDLNIIERLKYGWKGIHQELVIRIHDNNRWENQMYKLRIERWKNSGFNIMISPTSKKFWRIKNRSYACICGHKNDITTKLARCQLPGCNCNNYVISEKDYACSNCKRNPRQPWTWGFMTISL
jgi:hypothetical protein